MSENDPDGIILKSMHHRLNQLEDETSALRLIIVAILATERSEHGVPEKAAVIMARAR